MAKTRCSVFDEGLDAPCACSASMVRTVIQEGCFPTCAYYCQEHGDAHGAVLIDLADKVRVARARALSERDEHLVNVIDRALLGDELAIDECEGRIAEETASCKE